MMTKINTNNTKTKIHQPVLLKSVLQLLDPSPGDSYLDLTAGFGGHASAILEKTDRAETVLVDRDEMAMEALRNRFVNEHNVKYIKTDFVSAARQLVEQNREFSVILADFGVSSPQLDEGDRGFSFMYDAPLDMRMDQEQELTAEQVVNSYSTSELERILRDYGEEPRFKKIANAIIDQRPFSTTTELATVVKLASRGRGKIHPATKTFQALRIEVNQELKQIETLLPQVLKLLKTGGRVGFISFHSLEDRIVKRWLAEQSRSGYESTLKVLTKKPAVAGRTEISSNPRARSAKLRVAVKT